MVSELVLHVIVLGRQYAGTSSGSALSRAVMLATARQYAGTSSGSALSGLKAASPPRIASTNRTTAACAAGQVPSRNRRSQHTLNSPVVERLLNKLIKGLIMAVLLLPSPAGAW
eukprot:41134-Prorocentrum_minimum.AAC.2